VRVANDHHDTSMRMLAANVGNDFGGGGHSTADLVSNVPCDCRSLGPRYPMPYDDNGIAEVPTYFLLPVQGVGLSMLPEHHDVDPHVDRHGDTSQEQWP
jgi:hypothetical protein